MVEIPEATYIPLPTKGIIPWPILTLSSTLLIKPPIMFPHILLNSAKQSWNKSQTLTNHIHVVHIGGLLSTCEVLIIGNINIRWCSLRV